MPYSISALISAWKFYQCLDGNCCQRRRGIYSVRSELRNVIRYMTADSDEIQTSEGISLAELVEKVSGQPLVPNESEEELEALIEKALAEDQEMEEQDFRA